MVKKRIVEIFSAGCSVCEQAVSLVRDLTCASCEVIVLNMHESEVSKRANQLEIQSIPAVVIDGKLADCCVGRGPVKESLLAAGLGQPLV